MKKVLIAFLVLAFVSSASAAMIKPVISSLNGATIDPVDEITIGISDDINFDIILVDAAGAKLMTFDGVVLVTGPGTLDMTELTWPYDEGMNYGPEEIVPGKEYLLGTAAMNGMGEGIIIDHALLHCDDLGDVIISIVSDNMLGGTNWMTGPYDGEWGSVTVHQIPEPMTIALLGLGGLFLRRRK